MDVSALITANKAPGVPAGGTKPHESAKSTFSRSASSRSKGPRLAVAIFLSFFSPLLLGGGRAGGIDRCSAQDGEKLTLPFAIRVYSCPVSPLCHTGLMQAIRNWACTGTYLTL